MEVLETINKVFAHNLKKFRGDRTQGEIAAEIGLSLRGYQRLEAGTIPRAGLTATLAKCLGCQETALFLDPDLAKPTPEQALAVMAGLVELHKKK